MHRNEYDHELDEKTELRSGDGLVDSLLAFDDKNKNKLISDECYFFHCPHCEDFKADDQLLMGDHLVINHFKDYISCNAKPPEKHECSLCHKKV